MLVFYLSLIDNDEDKTKFRQLYEEYSKLMKYSAYCMLKDEFLAEDAVHEAFIRISRHMNGVEEVFSPKTRNFVVKIVKNICRDMMKAGKKYQCISYDEEYDQDFRPYTKIKYNLEEIEFSALIAKIKELPEIYRDVLLLKFHQGFSDREIADLLGITYAAVRKRVERARELLEYSLREWR